MLFQLKSVEINKNVVNCRRFIWLYPVVTRGQARCDMLKKVFFFVCLRGISIHKQNYTFQYNPVLQNYTFQSRRPNISAKIRAVRLKPGKCRLQPHSTQKFIKFQTFLYFCLGKRGARLYIE